MDLTAWYAFFTAMVACAATLSGLVFVAVSINLSHVIEIPGLSNLAAESLLQLLGAMFLALVALMPDQAPPTFGAAVACVTFALWLAQARLQLSYLRVRAGHPLRWMVSRVAKTQVACLPLFAAAALTWLHQPSVGPMLALGLGISLATGVNNAWVILIEVRR